ncbi:hypothetical protein [Metabacillus idriensis]
MLHKSLFITVILFIIMLLVVFGFHEEELRADSEPLTYGELAG